MTTEENIQEPTPLAWAPNHWDCWPDIHGHLIRAASVVSITEDPKINTELDLFKVAGVLRCLPGGEPILAENPETGAMEPSAHLVGHWKGHPEIFDTITDVSKVVRVLSRLFVAEEAGAA